MIIVLTAVFTPSKIISLFYTYMIANIDILGKASQRMSIASNTSHQEQPPLMMNARQFHLLLSLQHLLHPQDLLQVQRI